MATIKPFAMPKWGIEMSEGTIAEWMVEEGQPFSKGDTLCLIETDKITNEVEAEFDAVLRKIVVPSGETRDVGALLAVFADADTPQGDIDDFAAHYKAADSGGSAGNKKKKAEASEKDAKPAEDTAKEKNPAPTISTNRPISPQALSYAQENGIDLEPIEGSGRDGRITLQDVHQAARPASKPKLKGVAVSTQDLDAFFASPLAKRIAKREDIDLSEITGTGPRGRIRKKDVLDLVKPKSSSSGARFNEGPFVPSDNEPEVVPMDRIRKVVARRLTESKQEIPHFYLRMKVAVDALLELRKTANMVLGAKISLNDYLLRACAVALSEHPAVNIQVHGDEIHHFPHADISVAVATDKGLLTPIIRGVDEMRLDQLAAASRDSIERAKSGKLGYEELEGGTFSLSNLGMFGIDQFDAIVNPPQGAILAVGSTTREATEDENGDLYFESRLALSLSCDHRAIDGAVGAAFMATLREVIEKPERLFE